MQSISQVSPVRGYLVRSNMLARDGFAIFSDGFSRNSTIASSMVNFNMALWFDGSSSYRKVLQDYVLIVISLLL